MAASDEQIRHPGEQMDNYQGPGLLDLSKQNLHKLDPKLFSGETHTLILDQNHIIKLEHLERAEALQQLSVASNRLVRMMAVSKLNNLRVLNLPNNSIGYIEGLKDLPLLQWLNLAGNNIKVIEQLHSCVSLQHLDLSDNNISHIGDLTKLSALKTLLLHGNIITTLRCVPAHLPSSLTVLSLAENEIRDLTEVSYLAPLHTLEQLSIAGNPCVMPTPALPACDYRPYVVSWCLQLRVLDGFSVSQKEGLKGEWLYSQGKGRVFRPGQHGLLVQYLSNTCPVTAASALQSAEDAKLEKILNKQRQHQKQLQKTHLCCSQNPSRPTHLPMHLCRDHRSRDEEEDEDDDDVIPQTDVVPGVQMNSWMCSDSSTPVVSAARPPLADEDRMIVEDVTDEEMHHGSLLSSESAFLPFNPAVHHPESAPDSGEEEFEDSLAPPTSTQLHPPAEESGGGAILASHTHASGGLEQLSHTDALFNGDAVFQNGSVEDCGRTGTGMQCNAAVRIQAWWRGHHTRHCHTQAREVRAEIRLRRMQDHIVHLTAELDRVRQQQEEDRLQRRVQEEAVKFLWKQLQVVLEWQSSVNESSSFNPSIPAVAPVSTEISIPESGFHSLGKTQGAPDTSRISAGPPAPDTSRISPGSSVQDTSRISAGPPAPDTSRISAGSPAPDTSRISAGSPAPDTSRISAGSPAPDTSRISAGPPAPDTSRISAGSPAPDTSRISPGSSVQDTSRISAGPPAPDTSRISAGSPAPDTSRISAGSPVLSLGSGALAAGDSLLQQYLSSVQRLQEEEEGDATSDLSPPGKQERLS
ncbi:centrosomal protein of 97 kDa [Pimephales promelas]|uniref:centrosomal protein of 97 kDa n=1 Tax=Pimephales promelas TaxID=90988 RepID=UPI00195594D9|nr:centrosomal protein of 97 kDa [Pimephales promelas]